MDAVCFPIGWKIFILYKRSILLFITRLKHYFATRVCAPCAVTDALTGFTYADTRCLPASSAPAPANIHRSISIPALISENMFLSITDAAL